MTPTMPSEYRSTTEYRYSDAQADTIVRIASYHRKDFPYSVIWFSPRVHAGIHQSIETSSQRTPDTGLGFLDRLPLELIYDILLRLDMHSIFNIRQANLASRQIVNSLKQYQMVVSYGMNLFCALLRTRFANNVSLFGFYDALCTKACAFCGQFAGFISLLTWNRCCFPCLQGAPEIQVQTLAATRKQFHLTKSESNQLRSFKTLPGTYTMEESAYKSRTTVVSTHQAISVFRQKRNVPTHVRTGDSERNKKFNFMASCALPYYDKQTGRVEHGMSCAGCQLALEKGIIGSRAEIWAFEARDKVYARDGFLEHFRWCKQAQILWESSNEGNNSPAELPEGVRTGGYFSNRE
ncbi:hypothetical protein GGR53DRAFT_262678 [Hypoxylon sp. FL1150]|nr:hypothetical protein GGR53DRAFT_262678 [Hypoxylon sp. FL1150]